MQSSKLALLKETAKGYTFMDEFRRTFYYFKLVEIIFFLNVIEVLLLHLNGVTPEVINSYRVTYIKNLNRYVMCVNNVNVNSSSI